MDASTRSVLPLLLASALGAISTAQERPVAAWVDSHDVKTAPEPTRAPDLVTDRGPRQAGSPDAAPARPPKAIDPDAPIGGLRGIDHSRTYFDAPGDGSLWVRGANYKTSFDQAGATYFPLFGSRQEKHYPHALSPDRVTIGGVPVAFERAPAAAHSGERVELDRGPFVEAYDFQPGSIEQTFVFPSLPGAGELVVHIPLASELSASECVEGFEFQGALGKVTYGRATAIDAAGRRFAAPTSLGSDGITIRVGAEFLAAAEMPLVIDPVVSTFGIDTTSFDN